MLVIQLTGNKMMPTMAGLWPTALRCQRVREIMSDCIFCKNLPKVMENKFAYCLYDIKPITPGHMLVVLKRHHATVFESTPEEITAVFELLQKAKEVLIKEH